MVGRGLISRRDRRTVAAEAVIQPKRDHVHILADSAAGEDEPCGSNYACECRIVTAHPEMVILDAERPIRREAVFPADTQGAAPARVTCRRKADAGGVVEDIKAIARH